MFMNPYISRELARERQREMLAQARCQRLARLLHAGAGIAQHREQLWQRLRRALRVALPGLHAGTPDVTKHSPARATRGTPRPPIAV